MLTRYLATGRGNRVSMPVLFPALGERLGLDLALSTAPLHVFVQFTDGATGKTWNLETTSGAGVTRDAHYRKLIPMTDEAIANGVYLTRKTRRQTLAVIAADVFDHLLATGRYEEAVAVADVSIEADPADAYAWTWKGMAYYQLLDRDFMRRYSNERDIPADDRPRALALQRANAAAFARA